MGKLKTSLCVTILFTHTTLGGYKAQMVATRFWVRRPQAGRIVRCLSYLCVFVNLSGSNFNLATCGPLGVISSCPRGVALRRDLRMSSPLSVRLIVVVWRPAG